MFHGRGTPVQGYLSDTKMYLGRLRAEARNSLEPCLLLRPPRSFLVSGFGLTRAASLEVCAKSSDRPHFMVCRTLNPQPSTLNP